MISGVTRHMLSQLSGVPHLHVNRSLKSKSQRVSSNCYKSSNNLVKNNINLSLDRKQTNQRGTNYSGIVRYLSSDKTLIFIPLSACHFPVKLKTWTVSNNHNLKFKHPVHATHYRNAPIEKRRPWKLGSVEPKLMLSWFYTHCIKAQFNRQTFHATNPTYPLN